MHYAPRRKRRRKRKRGGDDHELPQTTNTNSRADAQNSIQLLRESPESLQPEQMMALQRQFGNAFIQKQVQSSGSDSGAVIQRMPTKAEMIAKLGKPHEDTKIFGFTKENSTKYWDVLKPLIEYEKHIKKEYIATEPDEIRAQMMEVNRLLDTIYNAMDVYSGKSKKAKYMKRRKGEVKDMQNAAARAFLEQMDNPIDAPPMTAFLDNAAANDGLAPLQLDADGAGDSQRGGSKSVTKYDMGDGKQGYFSELREKIQGFDSTIDPDAWNEVAQAINEQVDAEAQEHGWDEFKIEEEKFMRKNALKNEFRIGVQGLGFDPEDARMNQRDIAMSRLDQLLNTQLIARAQMAVVNMPDGSQMEGSIMEDAGADGGQSAADIMSDGMVGQFENREDFIEHRREQLGEGDPDLMRQLSRLYLIDIIAGQVDRNPANYFIHRDEDGRLLAITGIDNDLSFGMQDTADFHKQEMRGMSRYVDKELAEVIMELDAKILEPMLSDLLPPDQIEAAIARLEDLQQELKSDQTNLLEPDEWLQYREQIMEEKKDYYSSLFGSHVKIARGFKKRQ